MLKKQSVSEEKRYGKYSGKQEDFPFNESLMKSPICGFMDS